MMLAAATDVRGIEKEYRVAREMCVWTAIVAGGKTEAKEGVDTLV